VVTNAQAAAIFRELADLLLKRKEDWFKIRAYRKVADEIEKLTVDIATLEKDNSLRQIPGVGDAIEKKIREIIATGKLQKIEELRAALKDTGSERATDR
jgi:DNA polymerase (family X)